MIVKYNAILFQCIKYIEISIKQCKSGGIDCRVHGLAVMGKIVDDFGDPASSVSFLASDNEDVEVTSACLYYQACGVFCSFH